MILKYRLPHDMPEIGALAGDIISVDPTGEPYAWIGRPCDPALAADMLSRIYSSLEPVSEPVPPDLAQALLRGLGDRARARPARRRLSLA
jgi:hypothetical protein